MCSGCKFKCDTFMYACRNKYQMSFQHTHIHTGHTVRANLPDQICKYKSNTYNMHKLICFIFLGYIFCGTHLEDLECICACCSPLLYASIHTSIWEPIKQALTTHVNCVPHNKLYAHLQKYITAVGLPAPCHWHTNSAVLGGQ